MLWLKAGRCLFQDVISKKRTKLFEQKLSVCEKYWPRTTDAVIEDHLFGKETVGV